MSSGVCAARILILICFVCEYFMFKSGDSSVLFTCLKLFILFYFILFFLSRDNWVWGEYCRGYAQLYSNLAEKLQHVVKFATVDCQAPNLNKLCKQEKIKGWFIVLYFMYFIILFIYLSLIYVLFYCCYLIP
jgi:hypothetical protein